MDAQQSQGGREYETIAQFSWKESGEDGSIGEAVESATRLPTKIWAPARLCPKPARLGLHFKVYKETTALCNGGFQLQSLKGESCG